MKTISLLQPFASLMALGAKSIETRSKDFTGGYRGVIGIHASKGFPKENERLCYTDPFYSALGINYGNYYPHQYLPLGCIVAVGDLVDVVQIKSRDHAEDVIIKHLDIFHGSNPEGQFARYERVQQELAFGDYTPGRYMLLLRNVVALEKPIPAKGRLGLWEFEMEDPRR
jgi:hypothetical protein